MDDIEKVKQKIDIVNLIQEYIPLKKTGRNFKALCPFHLEKSPSFVVSEERQIWHCFGCGKGGDLLTFVMEYEKIEFSEALRYLADKAGVKLSGPVHKTEHEKRKETIYTLNNLAASFYNYLLLNHKVGEAALSYLVNTRKISLELIKKFNLGFAPNKTNLLTSYLIQKKGYKSDEIILAGLATRRGSGIVDFFWNRIIFPLFDTRGNVIAFSARVVTDSNSAAPKYINTRETPVYKKGDTLFALNFAKDAIKKEGKAILVEGEFDVISSFREGITNVAAIKGTSLTENQIKLLKRYTPKLSFCFDTDSAGEEAQVRSIGMIEKMGISVGIIIPESGKDPDEALKDNPLSFKKAIKNEINIYDFIIDTALKKHDPLKTDGKKAILDKTLSYLTLIENEVIKEHYIKKLAGALDASAESVIKQLEKMKHPQPQQIVVPSKKYPSREETMESYLLALILQANDPKNAVAKAQEVLGATTFTIILYRRIYDHVQRLNTSSKNEITSSLPSELLDGFNMCFLKPLPSFETEEEYFEEIEKAAYEVKVLSVKQSLKKLSMQMKEKEGPQDEQELSKLHQEFDKLTQVLRFTASKKVD